MIGLNRSILFNSVRRPKIQDLEIFVSGTVLIPFHDFTSFKIIFLSYPKDCTSSKLSQIQNCPRPQTVHIIMDHIIMDHIIMDHIPILGPRSLAHSHLRPKTALDQNLSMDQGLSQSEQPDSGPSPNSELTRTQNCSNSIIRTHSLSLNCSRSKNCLDPKARTNPLPLSDPNNRTVPGPDCPRPGLSPARTVPDPKILP